MRQEDAFASLPFETGMRGGLFSLSLELCLDKMIPTDQNADAGISAVIRSGSGGLTYWALTHPGTEPDFHRRDGFIIGL